eukprot:m.61213 g.61213  ORF g.61213 m.61213 type:complete len:72 (-) comp9546_c0_seq2:3224-3439(-)
MEAVGEATALSAMNPTLVWCAHQGDNILVCLIPSSSRPTPCPPGSFGPTPFALGSVSTQAPCEVSQQTCIH